MENLKIATKVVNKIPMMGIINAITFEEIVPFEYFFIKTIKNHKDLSLTNFDNIFLLFENNDDFFNNNCKFCKVSETGTFISSNKYQNLHCFYKGEAICNLNEKVHIINLNEELLRGPLDDLWDIHGDLEDNFRELIRCADDVRINYSYLKSAETNISSYFDNQGVSLVEVEEKLGYIKTRYSDLNYTSYSYLNDFNIVGLAVYKQNNKFGFLNRYLFEVANLFDYVFNNEELKQVGIINNDPLIYYIEKDNKILKIQFTGNFVEELIHHPIRFVEGDSLNEFFSERLNTVVNKSQIYTPVDIFSSPTTNFLDDEDFIQLGPCEFPLFISNETYKKFNVNNLINEHNTLFGLIPSCYIVLDEIAISIPKKQYDLIPFREGDKYGYKNHFQELIVPCVYDFTEPIINGYGAVQMGDKWGVINGKFENSFDYPFNYGDLIIDCIYDSIGDFSEGLLSVYKDSKWGFVDNCGKVSIPFVYDRVKSFSGGFAAVMLNNKAGFINKKGEIITEFKYEDVGDFENGFSGVTFGDKYGMINTLGEEVTMMHFEQTVAYSEGLFMVKLNDKVGFIDETWDWAVENKYDMAFPFSEGLAVVVSNNKYGYVDKKANVIIPLEYTDAYDFKSGIARVYKDGKFGFINPKGEIVIPFIYNEAEDFNDGYARVKLDGFYGVINNENEVIVPFAYDYIHPDCFSDGLVAASSLLFDGDSRIGYINKSAGLVIRTEYSNVSSFNNGIALVVKDKYDVNTKEFIEIQGFIDKQGNEYWKD